MGMTFVICNDPECGERIKPHGHFFFNGQEVGLPCASWLTAERSLAVFRKQNRITGSEAEGLMSEIRRALPADSPQTEEKVHIIATDEELEEEGLALLAFLAERGARVTITKKGTG